MAIIEKIKTQEGEIHESRQKETDCEWVVDKSRGMLNIKSFGSKTRKFPGEQSQNLIFTRETLIELRRIMDKYELGK